MRANFRDSLGGVIPGAVEIGNLNTSMTVVPEPGTGVLFGGALLGLGVYGRRQRLQREAAAAAADAAPAPSAEAA